MTKIVEVARAKINLTLNILGRRDDGFHELLSLVAFASVGDVLTLDTAGQGTPGAVTAVTGPFGGSIIGQNLVDEAIARLHRLGADLCIGHVTLQKNLPVAAGIGGGSADAAAVVRAVRAANAAHSETVDWHGLAAELGSDVPVCLASRAAWMTGRGETVTHLDQLPPLGVVLVNALGSVPSDKTKQVFQRLGAQPLKAPTDPLRPQAFHSTEELLAYMREHANDLAAPAGKVLPVIAEVKTAIEHTPGCRYAAVSGAGPTCFGIFDDPETAAGALRQAKPIGGFTLRC